MCLLPGFTDDDHCPLLLLLAHGLLSHWWPLGRYQRRVPTSLPTTVRPSLQPHRPGKAPVSAAPAPVLAPPPAQPSQRGKHAPHRRYPSAYIQGWSLFSTLAMLAPLRRSFCPHPCCPPQFPQ